MKNTLAGLILSTALLGGCVAVVHEHDDHKAPPPGQSGGGEDSKHPHGGPPGQTGEHPHGGPPGQTKKQVVVVEATHVCVATCDHYCVENVWYIEVGHKHGPDCGHVLVNGKWGQKDSDKDKDNGKGNDKDKDKDKKDKKDKK